MYSLDGNIAAFVIRISTKQDLRMANMVIETVRVVKMIYSNVPSFYL